jgi:hypothetical protein
MPKLVSADHLLEVVYDCADESDEANAGVVDCPLCASP